MKLRDGEMQGCEILHTRRGCSVTGCEMHATHHMAAVMGELHVLGVTSAHTCVGMSMQIHACQHVHPACCMCARPKM